MPKHQESAAKQATRNLLLQAAKHLNRPELTYMGMPAETARAFHHGSRSGQRVGGGQAKQSGTASDVALAEV